VTHLCFSVLRYILVNAITNAAGVTTIKAYGTPHLADCLNVVVLAIQAVKVFFN